MSAAFADEVKVSLRMLAEPQQLGDNIKSRIGRAARSAGMTYSRAYEVWYGRARRIDAHELEIIRAATQQREELAATRLQRNETLAEIYRRLESLEERIIR